MNSSRLAAAAVALASAFFLWAGHAAFAVAEAEQIAYNDRVDLSSLFSKMLATPLSDVFAVWKSEFFIPAIGLFSIGLALTTCAFLFSRNRVTKSLFTLGYLASLPYGLLSLLFVFSFSFDGEYVEEGFGPTTQAFGYVWIIATIVMTKAAWPRLMTFLASAEHPDPAASVAL